MKQFSWKEYGETLCLETANGYPLIKIVKGSVYHSGGRGTEEFFETNIFGLRYTDSSLQSAFDKALPRLRHAVGSVLVNISELEVEAA